MHDQAMIHGDLKGVWLQALVSALHSNTLSFKANILIDRNGHARLADFGLLTAISDPTNFTASSSAVTHGTTRWMSPELLHPDLFDLKDSRPTKESDCYAFGMVIYEVLSGRVPFAKFKEFIVMRKVIEGEHPERPEGAEGKRFTNDLWKTLIQCWATRPGSRPGIEAVSERLDQASNTWIPPPLLVDEEDMERDESVWEFETYRYPPIRPLPRVHRNNKNGTWR